MADIDSGKFQNDDQATRETAKKDGEHSNSTGK